MKLQPRISYILILACPYFFNALFATLIWSASIVWQRPIYRYRDRVSCPFLPVPSSAMYTTSLSKTDHVRKGTLWQLNERLWKIWNYNFSTASIWHSCPLCSLSSISASSLDIGNCPLSKWDSPSFSSTTLLQMSQINCCTINLLCYSCLIVRCLNWSIIMYFVRLIINETKISLD